MNRIDERWRATRSTRIMQCASAPNRKSTRRRRIAAAARQIAETLDLAAIACWTSRARRLAGARERAAA